MRDQLIRYLLGELDEVEQLHLEERLRQSAELRRELDYLRACFGPGNDAASPDLDSPPPDLARRIAEQVTNQSDESLTVASAQLASRAAAEPAVGSMSWSLA